MNFFELGVVEGLSSDLMDKVCGNFDAVDATDRCHDDLIRLAGIILMVPPHATTGKLLDIRRLLPGRRFAPSHSTVKICASFVSLTRASDSAEYGMDRIEDYLSPQQRVDAIAEILCTVALRTARKRLEGNHQ
jgi:hypothetical protein